MNPTRKTLLAVAFCTVLPAQTPPPTMLQIEVENLVQYQDDNSDPAKYATDPSPAVAVLPKNSTPRLPSATSYPSMARLARESECATAGIPLRETIIYARVSSKDQEKEGYSIPAQLELLRADAVRKGFKV